MMRSSLMLLLPASATAANCNLAGTWNIDVNDPSHPIPLTLVQNGANCTLTWGGKVATGTITDHRFVFGKLTAVASPSPWANQSTAKAPDCSLLTFNEADSVGQLPRWCRQPYCPRAPPAPPPGPPDPETAMPHYIVPGAAAIGAVDPSGKPANYFLNYTGSNGWVIHLSGGGWRFLSNDDGTGAESLGTELPPLTSDGTVPPGAAPDGHCYGKCDGILSDDPTLNPLFHSWNKVWVPITGTSFTGDRTSDKPYPVRGKRFQEAVIKDLQTRFDMGTAAEVILTGGSSGGLAVYLTCDRVAGLVAEANVSTRYTCLADAGYFLDHPDIDGKPSTSPKFTESFHAWNSSGGTNQACIEHYTALGTPEKCIFAQYVFPFIKSSIFVFQNLYDSWQINNILKIGCSGYNKPMTSCSATQMDALEKYGATMRTALAPAISSPKVGMFAPSCIAHCQSVMNEHPEALWDWIERWSIDGLTPQAAFNAWYRLGGVGGNDTKHVQECDWSPKSCNKLCPMWT